MFVSVRTGGEPFKVLQYIPVLSHVWAGIKFYSDSRFSFLVLGVRVFLFVIMGGYTSGARVTNRLILYIGCILLVFVCMLL